MLTINEDPAQVRAPSETIVDYLPLLRSPINGQRLRAEKNGLVSLDGRERYSISDTGVPLFAKDFVSEAGRVQQSHYDRIVARYVENLAYPHTEEYMAYLDEKLFELLPQKSLGTVAELCCGRGEAARLLGDRMDRCIGVDVSAGMLDIARRELPANRYFFVQGDVTMLPLANQVIDNVVMLGGIHHVPARLKLFQEVYRILKPGGTFYFREPANDFAPWRLIRRVVYRLSPALDHLTERPLQRGETEADLICSGLPLQTWHTYGFLGFCLFMNSDVLIFNRMFRFVPGIRRITRLATRLDDWTTRMPGLRGAGLQVIAAATRSPAIESPPSFAEAY